MEALGLACTENFPRNEMWGLEEREKVRITPGFWQEENKRGGESSSLRWDIIGGAARVGFEGNQFPLWM